MKTFIFLVAFYAVTVNCSAQFVLTPSSGLMTEDGSYIISREGMESENYYAAKRAIEATVPNAEIGDLEYEKSFNVTSAFKERRKLPGAIVATDWRTEYTLTVECADGKIMISFSNIGALEVTKKGEHVLIVYPTTGKNTAMGALGGLKYIFNSKGTVAKGCNTMKTVFEDYANNLVKNIEKNLK